MTVIDPYYLGVTAVVTVAYQLSFFLVANGFKFDKVTDFAGGTNFMVIAILTASLAGTWYPRQLIISLFVLIWGLRLSGFLLFRILLWGEDRRFDDKRGDFLQFAVFWTFQAVWVWTVSLPVTLTNASTAFNPAISAVDIVGCAMWAVGLLLETIADFQKLAFKKEAANRGRWCDGGVWKWSRHPNYFGEILLWTGIFLVSSPILIGWQWIAILSPLFTAAILLFLSGMPLLESSANKKYGGLSEYISYREKTSPLVPLPPSLYEPLPEWLKSTLLFEWPLYARELHPLETAIAINPDNSNDGGRSDGSGSSSGAGVRGEESLADKV